MRKWKERIPLANLDFVAFKKTFQERISCDPQAISFVVIESKTSSGVAWVLVCCMISNT
jgi:hypothetical protein